MKSNVAVIGAGSWGTALSVLLCKNGHSVKMWTRSADEADIINRRRENVNKLPGVLIPEGVNCTNNMEESLKDADLVAIVLPSQTIRKNAVNMARYIKENTPVVCCSKGLEEESGVFLSQVIKQEIPQSKVCVLSGPSHAEEVGRDIPTAVVAASEDIKVAETVQNIFMSPKFRVYTNPDIVGVELGGAIKNVIALCAGISDGLGFGDNTKAALITRGITEITRLGVAFGAMPETFAGLAGIGDLIVTCTSMHSRNRRAGMLIGQGKSMGEAIKEVGMVVEGINTAKAAYKLSIDKDVEMPIVTEAYDVLFRVKNPQTAVSDLMLRDKKLEMIEDI